METFLNVTPDALKNGASRFQAQATQVKSLHDDMIAKVNAIPWEGTAAESFKTKFGQLSKGMDMINRMILEHVNDLNEIAEIHENAERTAGSIADELPASNL